MGRAIVAHRGAIWLSFATWLIVCIISSARADFKLPILHPVPKIVSVPEHESIEILNNFKKMNNLEIEIRMTPSGLLSERLVHYLNANFPNVKKRFVTSGILRSAHILRYRKVSRIEIRHELGLANPDFRTINALYALGPVRKLLVLDHRFSRSSFEKIKRVKFSMPVINLSVEGLASDHLQLLKADMSRPIMLVIPYGFEAIHLAKYNQLHPLILEVHTQENQVNEGVLAELTKMEKADICIVINGGFTMNDATKLMVLDRFSLKIYLENLKQLIPGLVDLLEQMEPPS